MKSFTINRSHFFNGFICLPVALALIFTATVQAADKTPVTSAERVHHRIGLIGGRMVADMAEYGYFETALTALWTDQDITFRNLGWPTDDVFGTARSEFGSGAKTRSSWKPPANADQGFGYETLLGHVNDASQRRCSWPMVGKLRWFTHSTRVNGRHYITQAASNMALLALSSCGELRD